MSTNIYEDPDLTWKVRYNKGVREDGGERVERRVDIYESVEPLTGRRGPRNAAAAAAAAAAGARSRKHRSSCRAAALGFGLLSLLLLAGLAVLSKLYVSIIMEKQELGDSYEEPKSQINTDCQFDETHGNITGWRRFRCSCYFTSAERRSWSESRRDCQSRGADLVAINDKDEHEFIAKLSEHGASWVGLHSVETSKWERKWKWEWVDESSPLYLSWHVGVNVKPADLYTAYMEDRALRHTNKGFKQWICERKMF